MMRDTVGDWQELSALYERADALDTGALAAWLADPEQAGHSQLPELRRMLAARDHVASGDFLMSLPGTDRASRPRTPAWERDVGSRVGSYRLLRHIGSGGMAEVWLAERADGAFERQVAIKLLFSHPSRQERDSYVERFRRERDILASLSHPGIAALHDAGVTADGQPWLALEYVEGARIDAWCDACHATVEQRIGLFIEVLRAVEFAHANLVIHRDLKPANIIVTQEGRPKILDFGIAKLMASEGIAADASELTQEFGRPLTPQYASPEQIRGRPLGTASDVYSLGVMLYELLAGARPYDLAGLDAARAEQLITQAEPAPPSRFIAGESACAARSASHAELKQALQRDLDAIVLRSLGKEPAQRYSSAEAFRDDLERAGRGEPVRARRATPLYRARRFVERHRLAVGSAAVVLVVLVSVTALAVSSALDARRETRRAAAAKGFLVDIYRGAEPGRTPGSAYSGRGMLELGAAKATATLSAEPLLQADVLASIGQMQLQVSDYAAAGRSLARAHDLYASAGQEHKLADVDADLAFTALQSGDLAGAGRWAENAVRGAPHFADDGDLQVKVRLLQGRLEAWQGRDEAAREAFAGSLAIAEQRLGRNGPRAIEALRELAQIDLSQRRYAAGRGRLEDADRRLREAGGETTRDAINIAIVRAAFESEAGQFARAAEVLEPLQRRCDASLGAEAEDCVVVRMLRGTTAARLHDRVLAEALLPELWRQADDASSPRRQAESLILASRLFGLVAPATRRMDLESRLQGLARNPAIPAWHRGAAFQALAEARLRGRDFDGAEQAARLSLEDATGPAIDARKARSLLLVAIAMQQRLRTADVRADFDAADAAAVEAFGADHPLVAAYRMNALPSMRASADDRRIAATCAAASGALREAFGPTSAALREMQAACSDKFFPEIQPYFL